jgi:hypothetical protein
MYSGALGYEPLCYLYYVIGTAHNKCLVKWGWDSNSLGNQPGHLGQFMYGSSDHSIIRFETDAKKVYHSLEIEEGQVKMILDMCCHTSTTSFDSFLRKCFGFYVISLPTNAYSCFHTVVIFTPKPGLFSDTRPQ